MSVPLKVHMSNGGCVYCYVFWRSVLLGGEPHHDVANILLRAEYFTSCQIRLKDFSTACIVALQVFIYFFMLSNETVFFICFICNILLRGYLNFNKVLNSFKLSRWVMKMCLAILIMVAKLSPVMVAVMVRTFIGDTDSFLCFWWYRRKWCLASWSCLQFLV